MSCVTSFDGGWPVPACAGVAVVRSVGLPVSAGTPAAGAGAEAAGGALEAGAAGGAAAGGASGAVGEPQAATTATATTAAAVRRERFMKQVEHARPRARRR